MPITLTTGDVDVWAYCRVGDPFPENPVRVKGQQNMYPALWYKNGKPVFGRAWNNEGLVNCSFYDGTGKEVTGKFVQGQIQILAYKGSFPENKYWYDWVPFPDRTLPHFALVKCGNSGGILLKTKNGELVANWDMTLDKATVACGLDAETFLGSGKLAGGLVLVRNHLPPNVSMENKWADVRTGDPPPNSMHKADGRPLEGTGENYVALWYKNGNPVLGRAYLGTDGKIAASFGCYGREFSGRLGSIQILQYTDTSELGFDYSWKPYGQVKGGSGEWQMLKIGNSIPCIVVDPKSNSEYLGQYDYKEGAAMAAVEGKELKNTNPDPFKVLCRRNLA